MGKLLAKCVMTGGMPIFFLISMLLFSPSARPAEVGPLVTVNWLKQHAGDPNVVVLDIRDNQQDY